MSSKVVVIGSGPAAEGWATRFAAAGLDVYVSDPAVVDGVGRRWPSAQRLGLFPGASVDRVRPLDELAAGEPVELAQIVAGSLPDGLRPGLVAELGAAVVHEPIHLLPLVEVSGPAAAELAGFYSSLGMAPVPAGTPPAELDRLGPGIAALCAGDEDAIIAVMRALRPSAIGAGAAIAHHEALRFSAGATRPWQPGDVPAAPLALYATRVEPDWVDYNDHMTEAAYLTAAGWASDAMFRYIGDDEAYRAAGHSFYTVETHIHYLLEVDLHEPIRFTTQILGVDAKRVHLIHEMFHGESGALLCTAEQMLVHVDMAAVRSAPILAQVKAALDAIAASHTELAVPPQVGTVMRLPSAQA